MLTIKIHSEICESSDTGLHRSPYHGFSVEFSEYRQYSPGDDPRYLDWKLYARSDRYYIKRFEDETNLRCHLLVDVSRSMGFGSLAYPKVEYARTVAATLAYFLSTQRDAVGLVTFEEKITDYLPAAARRQYLQRLAEHTAAIERACSNLNIDFFQMTTERPLELALFDFVSARLRRGRTVVRRRSTPVRGPS